MNKKVYSSLVVKHTVRTDGRQKTTSLCPVLGRAYGQKYNEPCPLHLQLPYGKQLKVSFIGTKPYIDYDPLGGIDFLIVNMLAEKFKFQPKYIPERAYDIVKENGTIYGMLHSVRNKIIGMVWKD